MKRTLALAALATLAVCAPAAAAPKPPKKLIRWTYAITVKGEARYHHVVDQPAIGGRFLTQDDLTFRWTSKMPRFQILNGQVMKIGSGPVKLKAVEAKRLQSIPDPNGAPATGECSGTTATSGHAMLDDTLLAPLGGQRKNAELQLVPFSGVVAPITCVGKLSGPGEIRIEDTTLHHDSFGIDFELPPEAIGQGKIIELFDSAPKKCPGQELPFTVACNFDMHGTITLRKTGRKVLGPAVR
jgi:hypothetical protein